MCEITVVIPTYNRSSLVQRAIESSLNQTLKPKQIIVIDDGSKDGTAQACKRFGDAIRYSWQPNAGVSAARNHGVRLARHDWTAFLDSDDYWAPNHLESVAEAIKGTEGKARFYFTDMQMPNLTGENSLWVKSGFKIPGKYLMARDGTDWMMMPWQPCSLQCSVFNTAILKACGGFDPRYQVREDTELFCRLGIGAPICAVNNIGCIQTSDDEQASRLTGRIHTRSERYWEQERLLCNSLLARFPNLRPAYKRMLHYNLAVANWRLTQLQRRAGKIFRSAVSLFLSAKAQPEFLLWLIFHGKSTGGEPKVYPLQPAGDGAAGGE